MSISDRPAEKPAPDSGGGAENANRPGPNPRSPHPTGPHAPYEPGDTEGLAAEKHGSERRREPSAFAPEREKETTVRVVDLRERRSGGSRSE